MVERRKNEFSKQRIGVLCTNSRIAQSVEHGTYTATVASSSLVTTILFFYINFSSNNLNIDYKLIKNHL